MKKHLTTILVILAIAAVALYFHLNSFAQRNKRAADKMTIQAIAQIMWNSGQFADLGQAAQDLIDNYTKDELVKMASERGVRFF